MIVAHLINNLELGGAEKHLRTLSNQQICLDYKVFIFVLNFLDHDFMESFNKEVTFVDLSELVVMRKILEISRLCEENRVQILHSHLPVAEIFSSFCMLKENCKRVTTRHIPGNFSHRFKRNYLLPISRMVLRRADLVIAISKTVAKSLRDREVLKDVEVRVIPYGFEAKDKAVFSNLDKVRLEPRDKFVFLCVARLESQKRVWDLLMAFSEISAVIPNVILRVAGEGRQSTEMIAWIRNQNLEERIFLLGKVKDIQVEYSKADVFVLPTAYEGFGNVYMEAIMCNLPIISTKNEAILEIMDENQFYGYSIGDVSELVHLLKTTYLELSSSGPSNRYDSNEILIRFSASKMTSDIDRAYREILTNPLI